MAIPKSKTGTRVTRTRITRWERIFMALPGRSRRSVRESEHLHVVPLPLPIETGASPGSVVATDVGAQRDKRGERGTGRPALGPGASAEEFGRDLARRVSGDVTRSGRHPEFSLGNAI